MPPASASADSGTPVAVSEVQPVPGEAVEARDAGQGVEVEPPPSPARRLAVAVKPATAGTGTASVRRTVLPPRRTLPKGRVEFRVRPFGTVYLDGKNLGQTPFAAVEATEGSHQVRVVNKDLGKDVTRAFEVKAGQDNVFKLNLAAE